MEYGLLCSDRKYLCDGMIGFLNSSTRCNNNQCDLWYRCHDHRYCPSSPGSLLGTTVSVRLCVCLSFNECTLGARWPPTFKPSQPALAVKQLSAASNVVICYCCSSIVSDILILQSCIVPHSLCMIRICADGSGFRFAPVWQFSVNWRDRDGCLLLSLFF